jgi:hypothetical protein
MLAATYPASSGHGLRWFNGRLEFALLVGLAVRIETHFFSPHPRSPCPDESLMEGMSACLARLHSFVTSGG